MERHRRLMHDRSGPVTVRGGFNAAKNTMRVDLFSASAELDDLQYYERETEKRHERSSNLRTLFKDVQPSRAEDRGSRNSEIKLSGGHQVVSPIRIRSNLSIYLRKS